MATAPPAMQRRPVLVVAATGFTAQLTQIILLRELLTFFSGLELIIGLVLGIWMAFVALGALVSGRILKRGCPLTRLALLLGLGGLASLSALVLARLAGGVFGSVSGQELGMGPVLLLTALTVSVPALAFGAAFPLAARALRRGEGEEPKPGSGAAYLFEAAGAAAAGTLFTFVLVHLTGPLFMLCLGFFLAMALAFGGVRSRPGPAKWWTLAGTLLFAGLLFGAGPLDRVTEETRWRTTHPKSELVETRDSRRGRISVLRYREQHSFFVAGRLVYSLPDEAASAAFAHLIMVQHPRPARVLLVGGGLTGTAGEILRHPVEHLDIVELDGRFIEVAWPFLPAAERSRLESRRVTVHSGDGRLLLKRTPPETYDMVLLRLPDPSTASLNRFYTLEFFQEVSRALAPGGVCAFTLSSELNYMSPELRARNGALYHTFHAVFEQVRVIPGGGLIFLGMNGRPTLSLSPAELARRYAARGLTDENRSENRDGFTVHHYDLLLENTDVDDVNRELRTWPWSGEDSPEASGDRPLPDFFGESAADRKRPWTEPAPVAERVLNSDDRPGASLGTLLQWSRKMNQTGMARLLEAAAGLSPGWALLPALLLPLGVLLSRARGPQTSRRVSLLQAVAVVGFAELVFELAILFSFQNYYGFVYREMGILFAVFMTGLASGTWVSNRWFADRPRPGVLAAILGGCLAWAILLPLLLSLLGTCSVPWIAFVFFGVLTFAAGTPVGLFFPQACASMPPATRRAGSTLYAADLSGGLLGAVGTGTLLLPALGLTRSLSIVTALLLAGSLAALGAGWAAGRRS